MGTQTAIVQADQKLPAEVAPELVPALPAANENAAIAKTPAKTGGLRRALLAGVAVAALAAASWYGWNYWTVGRFQVSTDDAYVKADNTTIAPRISGYLGSVLVGDNEPVKAG